MDELSIQIASGFSLEWERVSGPIVLPEHTKVAYCAKRGARRVIFLRVQGYLRSAMPLFEANVQLRKLEFETVWLFDGEAIPSTKHMPCASIRQIGDTFIAKIENVSHDESVTPQVIEIAALAKAVAQQRVRLAAFAAGRQVNVTFTWDEMVCIRCGAISFEVEKATFHAADHPGAPGLALNKTKIGRCVSALIVDALKWYYPSIDCVCEQCQCVQPNSPVIGPKATRTIGGIELSKLAAFELVRHHSTAWYVA